MTYEQWWWEFIAEHEDWRYADSDALRKAAFEGGQESLRQQLAKEKSLHLEAVQECHRAFGREAAIKKEMARRDVRGSNPRTSSQLGWDILRQQLAKLTMQCEKVVKWKHAMSYNDSYFGEPAGDLKRIVYEIERSMPIRGNK